MLRDALKMHQAGDLDGALRLYRKILSSDPTHGSALHGESLILESRGALEEALTALRKAAGAVPPSAQHLFNLARIEARSGNHQRAEDAYHACVAAKPDFADG